MGEHRLCKPGVEGSIPFVSNDFRRREIDVRKSGSDSVDLSGRPDTLPDPPDDLLFGASRKVVNPPVSVLRKLERLKSKKVRKRVPGRLTKRDANVRILDPREIDRVSNTLKCCTARCYAARRNDERPDL